MERQEWGLEAQGWEMVAPDSTASMSIFVQIQYTVYESDTSKVLLSTSCRVHDSDPNYLSTMIVIYTEQFVEQIILTAREPIA